MNCKKGDEHLTNAWILTPKMRMAIREAMQVAIVSQSKLAAIAGTYQSTVSQLVSGSRTSFAGPIITRLLEGLHSILAERGDLGRKQIEKLSQIFPHHEYVESYNDPLMEMVIAGLMAGLKWTREDAKVFYCKPRLEERLDEILKTLEAMRAVLRIGNSK